MTELDKRFARCPLRSLDGETYVIVSADVINEDLPQLSKFTVKRLRDDSVIENYPAYLLVGHGLAGKP